MKAMQCDGLRKLLKAGCSAIVEKAVAINVVSLYSYLKTGKYTLKKISLPNLLYCVSESLYEYLL